MHFVRFSYFDDDSVAYVFLSNMYESYSKQQVYVLGVIDELRYYFSVESNKRLL